MVYGVGRAAPEPRSLAERLDGDPAVDVALFRDGESAVARRDGEELRFSPGADGSWETSGDLALLSHPNALERAWTALHNPNAGDLLVSASLGHEFSDLGGRHHLGGGSHGSLAADDSEVPVLAVGLDAGIRSITDITPAALAHFGVAAPPYARPLGVTAAA